MPDPGYPPDWGRHYYKCHFCGQRCHPSGSAECSCRECKYCETMFPPKELKDEDVCVYCAENGCWAWLDDYYGDDGLDDLIHSLHSVFDSKCDHGIEDTEEILTKIRKLKSALELVDKRLVDGYDKTFAQ